MFKILVSGFDSKSFIKNFDIKGNFVQIQVQFHVSCHKIKLNANWRLDPIIYM